MDKNKNNDKEFDNNIEETLEQTDIINENDDIEDNSIVSGSIDSNDEIINALKSENQQLQDKLLRALAEAENARKRCEKRIEESTQYSITQFAKDLLSVMDNLSLAIAHSDSENLLAGVQLTRQELINIFKNKNIEEFKPQVGETFDYNLHNAISQVVTNDQPEGSIINVMQSGYKIKDRLLRPALVSVAKNS